MWPRLPAVIMSNLKKLILVALVAMGCMIFAISSKKVNPLYPKESQVFTDVCKDSMAATDIQPRLDQGVPVIYFITPTYTRREQVAELTRLSQTLLHIKNLVWIIAEDSKSCSQVVGDVLNRHADRIPHVHLISPMPEMYKSEYYKPRGVSSRNAGIKWILEHEKKLPAGILYLGDDDNTYDLRLFEEIRNTKKVSMLPVGFVGPQGLSGPIVRDGKVIGFSDSWFESRKFPVDMAGFAVTTELIKRHRPKMAYKAGHEEDLFLRALNVTFEDIEPLARDCTEVLVWHTQTIKEKAPKVRVEVGPGTNLDALIRDMSDKGLLTESTSGKRLPVCMKRDGCKTR